MGRFSRLIAVVEDDVPAVPKERPRAGRGGRFYTPQRTKKFEERVSWLVKAAGIHTPATGDLCIQIDFTPQGWKMKVWELEATLKHRRGDIDNLVKGILDGAQKGGLFVNDRQVVELDVRLTETLK